MGSDRDYWDQERVSGPSYFFGEGDYDWSLGPIMACWDLRHANYNCSYRRRFCLSWPSYHILSRYQLASVAGESERYIYLSQLPCCQSLKGACSINGDYYSRCTMTYSRYFSRPHSSFMCITSPLLTTYPTEYPQPYSPYQAQLLSIDRSLSIPPSIYGYG